ncbi:hypothetical protein SDC9_204854 [bioreactor metagenome]|jgi:prevent-host-death family protein|uniref:Antitoxin n=2 Tax=root TaxID=1 RepID=A0AAN0MIJ8_9ACTN|nr:type II toxin-antitoxin system prevent-host-death family antitoxin [Brooklawnia sp. SH051]BEH03204.1 hypothetical protein brsh051_24850 [Brooklawnia sp. SH051]
MKTITVAELRQNPTEALNGVEAGETYLVTKHRRPVAKLVPYEAETITITPPRKPGGSRLADRPRDRVYGYDEVEALLAEMEENR